MKSHPNLSLLFHLFLFTKMVFRSTFRPGPIIILILLSIKEFNLISYKSTLSYCSHRRTHFISNICTGTTTISCVYTTVSQFISTRSPWQCCFLFFSPLHFNTYFITNFVILICLHHTQMSPLSAERALCNQN